MIFISFGLSREVHIFSIASSWLPLQCQSITELLIGTSVRCAILSPIPVVLKFHRTNFLAADFALVIASGMFLYDF